PGTCPTAAILKPLSQTALFAPGQPHEPPGVAFYGLLSEVEAKCDRAGDAVRLALDVVVVGERGPAAGGASALDLWYFVAVTGPDQAVLGKRLFPVHIDILGRPKRAAVCWPAPGLSAPPRSPRAEPLRRRSPRLMRSSARPRVQSPRHRAIGRRAARRSIPTRMSSSSIRPSTASG